jgi:hypothetical protein
MTNRCGAGTIDALNDVLLSNANDARVAKTGQVRADTTVVPANVSSGLPNCSAGPALT